MTKFRLPRRVDVEIGTRRLGALERRSIKIRGKKRFLQTALGDGLSLFHRPSEITSVLRRFEELGLADLLDPPSKSEYEDDAILGQVPKIKWEGIDISSRICAAIGAKAASIETFGEDDPLPWQEFDERETEAWFLTNFAYFYSRQNAFYTDIEECLSWAYALGRLLEWWRWRSEGHDADAVRGQHFNPRRPHRKKGVEAHADTCLDETKTSIRGRNFCSRWIPAVSLLLGILISQGSQIWLL